MVGTCIVSRPVGVRVPSPAPGSKSAADGVLRKHEAAGSSPASLTMKKIVMATLVAWTCAVTCLAACEETVVLGCGSDGCGGHEDDGPTEDAGPLDLDGAPASDGLVDAEPK